MSFSESIKHNLSHYADFEGRASRSEFWWFFLFNLLIGWIAAGLGIALILAGAAATSDGSAPGALFWVGIVAIALGAIAQLAVVVPLLAVGCRRLHDRGQSGWLQLLLLVPCANIVLYVFWAMEGTPGDNAYGPEPA